MKKVSVVCLLLLASAALVTADVTVRWAYWGGESRVRISQQAIALFEKGQPRGFRGIG